MRTIIALSGLSLVVFTALFGKELADEPPTPSATPPPIAIPPRSITTARSPTLATAPAAAKPAQPSAALIEAIDNSPSEDAQRARIISELERSGAGASHFTEQGFALGNRLTASGIVTDFRCFAAGCYFVLAKHIRPEAEGQVVEARDTLAPNAVLAITHAAPPNKLVVLINVQEGS